MIFFNQGIIAPRFKPFSYLIVIYISHVVMLAPLETFLRCIYVTSQRRSIHLNYSLSQLFCSPNQNIVDDSDQEKKIENLVLYPLTETQMKIL